MALISKGETCRRKVTVVGSDLWWVKRRPDRMGDRRPKGAEDDPRVSVADKPHLCLLRPDLPFLVLCRCVGREVDVEVEPEPVESWFTYSNVRQRDASGREFTIAVIHQEEAKIIIWIFRVYLEGWGPKAIASDLNRRAVPSPCAGRRGTGSWDAGLVREILRRERYRGVYIHGRKDRIKRGGKRIARAADPAQILRVEIPEWRIVPEKLWEGVQARLPKLTARNKSMSPRSTHALAGIAKCTCGGGIVARNTKTAAGRVKGYTCGFHHQRGDTVCAVTVCQPMAEVDGALVDYVRGMLTDALVVDIAATVRVEFEREMSSPADTAAMEAEINRLRMEQKRLAAAVARVPDAEELLTELQDRASRIKRLEADLASVQRGPAMQRTALAKVEAMARAKLSRLREALGRDPEGTREVFSELFEPGDLRLSPVEVPNPGRKPRKVWRIEGSARFNLDCDPTGNRTRDCAVRGRRPNR
jgi:hypothetical protein